MLQVDNLSGGYGNEPVVKAVTFDVKKGEVLGILGPERQWEVDADKASIGCSTKAERLGHR